VNPRPTAGAARPWSFPTIHRAHLDNGVQVVTIPLPGKTLCAAELVLDAGAAFDEIEGVATLLARAFNEGTAQRDAGAFAGAHLVPVSRFREVAARLERELTT